MSYPAENAGGAPVRITQRVSIPWSSARKHIRECVEDLVIQGVASLRVRDAKSGYRLGGMVEQELASGELLGHQITPGR